MAVSGGLAWVLTRLVNALVGEVRPVTLLHGVTEHGIATGLGLLALVTRVVSVTAGGETADPPLAVVLDPLLVVAGVVLFVVLTAALVGVATHRAFAGARGPLYRETDA